MSVTPTRIRVPPVNVANGVATVCTDSTDRVYTIVQNLGPAAVYLTTDAGAAITAGYRVAAGDTYSHDDGGPLFASVVKGATTVLTVVERSSSHVLRPHVLGH